jgi:hypothetical protein
VIAVDAGPMQIQLWEEAGLKCAETALQGTTHDKLSAKSDSGHKVPQKLWVKKHEEGIDRATRHSSRERSEERGVFELERVVSCRNAQLRWRTKLDFGCGESFDDLHHSTAFRAAPGSGRVFGGGGLRFGLRLLCRAQQLKAKRQERGALAVGQEAEVTDAHEAFRKDVQ